MNRIEPFITSYGTKIDSKRLSDIIRRIKRGESEQNIITEELRSLLPLHEQDIDEAYEIYDYCFDLVDEETLETEIERFSHAK